ncbi:MAG: AAA family ATPase [Lachnospiraceae bacterium]|nr:AAA family ATPase [Lachnospiraceae bacterium]
MIKYLFANNYKTFVNFKVDFGRSSLLIGKNGSGKSNVLTLIASIRDVVMGGRAVRELFPATTVTRWMKSNIQTFELGLSDDDHDYVYRLEIEQSSETRVLSERVYCDSKVIYQKTDGSAEVYDDDLHADRVLADSASSGIAFAPTDSRHSLLKGFRSLIGSIILCTPNPKTMSDLVQNDVFIPTIDFSNIASTFWGVVLLDPDVYRELADTFGEMSSGFTKARIAVEPFGKHLALDYMYKDVSCTYLFSELSDGEKMLFALYILLYGYIGKGMTVLLDEPDNYVSLREIQPWCINLERKLEEAGQCIIVSHHPEIINYMAETDGIWLSRLSSGESKIMDKPDVGINEELLTYSEMISRGLLDEAE